MVTASAREEKRRTRFAGTVAAHAPRTSRGHSTVDSLPLFHHHRSFGGDFRRNVGVVDAGYDAAWCRDPDSTDAPTPSAAAEVRSCCTLADKRTCAFRGPCTTSTLARRHGRRRAGKKAALCVMTVGASTPVAATASVGIASATYVDAKALQQQVPAGSAAASSNPEKIGGSTGPAASTRVQYARH